tara:strand:- start:218 stop:337 length:120 start_codon:yes stop_codon:yes gene_type:complete
MLNVFFYFLNEFSKCAIAQQKSAGYELSLAANHNYGIDD